MNMKTILDENGMRETYGQFYDQCGKVQFDLADVPAPLVSLVPYARLWGVSDDLERESRVQLAPQFAKQNLAAAVCHFDQALDDWLAGDESFEDSPSDAYVAFSAMRMASDVAELSI